MIKKFLTLCLILSFLLLAACGGEGKEIASSEEHESESSSEISTEVIPEGTTQAPTEAPTEAPTQAPTVPQQVPEENSPTLGLDFWMWILVVIMAFCAGCITILLINSIRRK